MGAGASTERELEAVLACSVLIGEAMMQGLDPRYVRFPDMFRIYDFHIGSTSFRPSSIIMAHQSLHMLCTEHEEEEQNSGEEEEFKEDVRKHLIVFVEKDRLILNRNTLLTANDEGWTPLHSCCHTSNTIKAGIEIIKSILNNDHASIDWETKTMIGPGSFSSQWTALHIAGNFFSLKKNILL